MSNIIDINDILKEKKVGRRSEELYEEMRELAYEIEEWENQAIAAQKMDDEESYAWYNQQVCTGITKLDRLSKEYRQLE